MIYWYIITDGTKTTFNNVMSDIMSGTLTPQMYVNTKGEYKILVVVGNNSIPENLLNMGYSFGNPESDLIIINTQGGQLQHCLPMNLKRYL